MKQLSDPARLRLRFVYVWMHKTQKCGEGKVVWVKITTWLWLGNDRGHD